MATTFDVISLGTFGDIDPTEGNNLPDNATLLEGTSIGSAGAPLWANIQTLSLDNDADGDALYDMDNLSSNDTFSIDGGPGQVFDSVAVYTSTITYNDGSTATADVIVIQDTAGQLYLTPQKSANADQAALEARPIESISLDTYTSTFWAGTTTNFEPASFATPICLAEGTLVLTDLGEIPVDALGPGAQIVTADRGLQTLHAVFRRNIKLDVPTATQADKARCQPIGIRSGSLGPDLPRRNLTLSPQHRIVVRHPDPKKAGEILVPIKACLAQTGIRRLRGKMRVTYFALLFDRHEVIFAEGLPVESLRPGPVARASMTPLQRETVAALYPGAAHLPTIGLGPPARPLWTVKAAARLFAEHPAQAPQTGERHRNWPVSSPNEDFRSLTGHAM